MKFILFLVDDEQSVRKGVAFNLKQQYEIHTYPCAEDALQEMNAHRPDLILLDIGLPGMNGIDALAEIKKHDPQIIVLMITAYDDIATVVTAMKQGAHDYVVKPIRMDALKIAVDNALDTIRLRREIQQLQEKCIRENQPFIVGESEAIQDVMHAVTKVAASVDTPVLITGDSGTGKELIAHAIHYKSPNFRGPFVSLNCAAIPQQLIESELFGYEKGAFSGANPSGKAGLIEQAENGTLFLDEIGDLSVDGQTKLLRFLEDGEYYRVGGTRKYRLKTRIVSATNQNLGELIAANRFRLDLYYRLSVVKIAIPSLNERRKDILPIARFFLTEFSQKHGKAFQALSTSAEKWLVEHQWVGNVRELRNIIERGVIMEHGPALELPDVCGNGTEVVCLKKYASSPTSPFCPLPPEGIDLAALERHFIHEALQQSGDNDRKAADLLKMNYYAFRYRKKKLDQSAAESPS